MHDIEYIMVDIVNQEAKMNELMDELVNHPELEQAIRFAVEGSDGRLFVRLCEELAMQMARDMISAKHH